ncbi:STAS domain-containing protein [Candidatus Bathyarchaeota archaeon]|nr:STAS domain-containing protein [Candidatus Bathyarchaeota archaeon]
MSIEGSGSEYSLTKIGDTLLISPYMALHDSEIIRMTNDILDLLGEGKINNLIIDVSGIITVDSFLIRAVGELANSARLLGVSVVISGIRPDTAITLVELGISFPDVKTALNLEEAMKFLKDETS